MVLRVLVLEGRVKTDSPADFERLTRLRELITGKADSRSEVRGEFSLGEIQARHRRQREQQTTSTAKLIGLPAPAPGDPATPEDDSERGQ